MMTILQVILAAVLVAVAVNFVFYTGKNERVLAIDAHQDFIVRYPRCLLYTSRSIIIQIWSAGCSK